LKYNVKNGVKWHFGESPRRPSYHNLWQINNCDTFSAPKPFLLRLKLQSSIWLHTLLWLA
jgi:hypothetical protein